MKTRITLLSASMLLLQACDVTSPLRQDKPETFEAITTEQNQSAGATDPQVNILFVVDNSQSMRGHQAKLAANIEKFANEFLENSRIDYRIGVVPVYDSRYLNDKKEYRSGFRKMNPLGELVPLVGTNSAEKQLYITRNTPNPKEVLKNTVLIGTQWGPEAEESFSPVLAVTDPQINNEKNQGFYIPEAHLVVILLTDADDVSPGLSAEDFYYRLVQLKNGDRSKVLIAAAVPNLAKSEEFSSQAKTTCTTDGKGPIQAIPSLLRASGGIVADLCSDNFGTTLASFGQLLKQRIATQTISIGYTPDINSLVVSYGLKDQPESERQQLKRDKGDYILLPETNQIIINPDLKLQRIENAKIWITAKPVNLGNSKNGRLNTL